VGGIIGFVTPTSFLAGEYYKRLRQLIVSEAPVRRKNSVERVTASR
jgi:hypothetical protein